MRNAARSAAFPRYFVVVVVPALNVIAQADRARRITAPS